MSKIDVSIIIVSFNTSDLTISCIRSVVQTIKKKSFEIIVVDNASTDNSCEEIKKNFVSKYKNIALIENSENLGFSKANNLGVKKSSGKYILFLNSDTVVYENTIDGMIDFMEKNPDCGASTCFLRMPDGKLDDASHRGFPTPWRALSHFAGLSNLFPTSRLFSGYSLGFIDLKNTHEIDALAGAFMLVERNAGEKAGWWDEDFFFYGEDLDFCFKLKETGYKIYFVPEFEILHYKGVSGGIKKQSQNITLASRQTKMKVNEARFTAMRIFYDKHYKDKYPSFLRSIVLAGISIKKIIAGYKL